MKYTLSQLQAMPDEELVPLCATGVMRWEWIFIPGGQGWRHAEIGRAATKHWNPLTNWNDTMKVIYCLKSRGEQVVLDFYNRADGDLCEIAKPSDRGSTGVSCDDMQRAIVIASILATQS